MKTRHLTLGIIGAALLIAALIVAYPWIYIWGAGRFWDRAEPEVHLIPEGYVGPVVILLNDSSASREREGSARLFRIDSKGVGHSAFGVNEGWGRPEYYYVDANGHRSPIVPGTPCDWAIPGDPIQACLLGHTTFSNQADRQYDAYVVGRRADQGRWSRKSEEFVDSVVYGRKGL